MIKLGTCVLLLAIIFIGGCTTIDKQHNYDEVTIRWVRTTDSHILKECKRGALGCYRFNRGICYIFTRVPEIVNGPTTRTVGHEVIHCFWGKYHGGKDNFTEPDITHKELLLGIFPDIR